MANKTSFEARAEEMLRAGAKRLGPGDVVTLRPGYKVKVLTGFGAWDQKKRRLVCTGRVETDEKFQVKDTGKSCGSVT